MAENEQGTLQEQLSELDAITAEVNEKKTIQKKKKKKYILTFSIVFLTAVAALLFALFSPSQQLKRVLAQIDAGGYNDTAILAELESFKTDKGLPLKEPDKSYYEAILSMNKGLEEQEAQESLLRLNSALDTFQKLADYKKSANLFEDGKQIKLQKILTFIDAGNYDTAVLTGLEEYKTNEGLPFEEPDKSYYEAIIAMGAGLEVREEWDSKAGLSFALSTFEKLGSYKKSENLHKETSYRHALALIEDAKVGKYMPESDAFRGIIYFAIKNELEELGDYKNSKQLLEELLKKDAFTWWLD